MPENHAIPILSEDDLKALGISTDDVIESIEGLIRAGADGNAWSAPKAVIQPGDGRYMMAALAAANDPALLAVKTVVLNPENPKHGHAQINGLVTMLDANTGLPAAVMDGNWITAVRTAGLSATAARHLARKDAAVVGFVGTGVQARSHLDAFADMFPLEAVRIFGRGRANIDALAAYADEKGLSVTVVDSGDAALEESDLVVTSITATAQIEPFLDGGRMKPGSFAAVTDLGVPWRDETLHAFDRIIIDDVAQEKSLPNKIVPPDCISGDLQQLVLGKVPGRENDQQVTGFFFRGHALGDLALASLCYRKAGLG